MKYLIVGLGNIGAEYSHTRHNIGFDVLDKWVDSKEEDFDLGRLANVVKFKFRGKQVVCIKPTTYMNLSGKALRHWMSTEKVAQHNVLVITDDIALPLGKLRMRLKGSAGGHNGLKDIINVLGNDQFCRIKFGIGDAFSKGKQVDFVLGKWNDKEEPEVALAIDKCVEMVESFVARGPEQTMNMFND